jgi:DNA-binding GntR family transcriptional regulator
MEKQERPTNTWGAFKLRSVRRENLGTQVFEQVKGMILRGEIPPGRRIIENEVADSMGISRTPVREAVHRLAAEGFLNPLPKGGYAVRGLTLSGVEETFDIRSTLESFAAFLAAKRFADEELLPLEEKIDEFQRYLDGNDLSELTRINTDFHELLYALSRSPRLIKMIHDLRDDIFLLRKVMLNSADMARLSNRDHREMIRAMKKRDSGKVEKLVKKHILRGKEYILKEIGKGDSSVTHYFFEQGGGEENQ